MLENFLNVLTRIAVALETIAGNGGLQSGAPDTTAAKTTTTTGKGAAGKGAAAGKGKAVPTEEETSAALTELRNKIDEHSGNTTDGLAIARKIMSEVASVAKMKDIPEDKRAEVIKRAAAELEAYLAANADNDM